MQGKLELVSAERADAPGILPPAADERFVERAAVSSPTGQQPRKDSMVCTARRLDRAQRNFKRRQHDILPHLFASHAQHVDAPGGLYEMERLFARGLLREHPGVES